VNAPHLDRPRQAGENVGGHAHWRGQIHVTGAAMTVFVFDAYGTLFDVHAAIGRYRSEAGPDADRISDLWRTKQLEYTWTLTLAGKYEDFWILTERALDYALARFPSANMTLRHEYLKAYLSLDAYPDARTTLAALRARGLKTAILSNGTPKMLDAAVTAAGMSRDFDALLSVDSVKMFKPRMEVYRLATEALKVAPQEVVFASSNRWDVMGARAFGFRPVWINRAGMPEEYPDLAPVSVVRDLSSLANIG
jgi:2-haloacid dehalogenase